MGFWVLRLGVPRALLALFEPFFFWPGDFPRLFAPSDEPVDGVALAAELVAVVVEGETWRDRKKGNTLHSNYEVLFGKLPASFAKVNELMNVG